MINCSRYGLFTGLVTMPFGDEKRFVKNEIETLFRNYKEQLTKHSSTQSEYKDTQEKNLYIPKFYITQGGYDLACYSLVEDFTMGSQIFRPFNSFLIHGTETIEKNYRPTSYSYQILGGMGVDYLKKNEANSTQDITRDEFNDVIANPHNWPFTAICRIKLNSALIIGNGIRYKRFVGAALSQFLSAQSDQLKYFLLDSFSCHEILLVLYADSYKPMSDAINSFREWDYHHVAKTYNSAQSTELDLIERSLHRTFSDDPEKIGRAHLFVNTQSIFGFDYSLAYPDKKGSLPKFKDTNNSVKFTTSWHIKPGHFCSAMTELRKKGINTSDIPVLIAGGGVKLAPYVNADFSFSHKEAPALVSAVSRPEQTLANHVRKVYTELEFAPPDSFNLDQFGDVETQSVESDPPIYFHYRLGDDIFSFNIHEIERFRESMQSAAVSRVVRERVINMIVDYNDGITDPILFTYFIELRPFLQNVINTILSRCRKDKRTQKVQRDEKGFLLNDINEMLNRIADFFDRAYFNRFGQSYRILSVTDYTLEHNGGIQQLVSCFDVAYKALSSTVGGSYITPSYSSIAVIGGYPGVESNRFIVRLNYFHIFQMEVFAMIASHEAANTYLEKIGIYVSKDFRNPECKTIKDLLHDANKGESDQVIQNNLAQLPQRIKDYEYYTARTLSLSLCQNIEGLKVDNLDTDELQQKLKNLQLPLTESDSELKYQISKVHYHSTFLNLLGSDQKRFWSYIIIDSIVLTLAFKGDKERFWYFHWGYFCQLFSTFDNYGNFDEGTLKEILLRLMVCLKLHNPEEDFRDFVNPPFSQLSIFWAMYFNVARRVINILFRRDDSKVNSARNSKDLQAKSVSNALMIQSYLLRAKEVIDFRDSLDSKKEEIKNEEEIRLSKSIANVIQTLDDTLKNDHHSSDSGSVNRYRGGRSTFPEFKRIHQSLMDFGNVSAIYKLAILRDKIFTDVVNDMRTREIESDTLIYTFEDFIERVMAQFETPDQEVLLKSEGLQSLYVNCYHYAYLDNVYKLNVIEGEGKNAMVYRQKSTGTIPIEKADKFQKRHGLAGMQYAPYLFDQIGGVFTHQLQARKNHLKRRGEYFNSMWDFAQIIKKQMIEKRKEIVETQRSSE